MNAASIPNNDQTHIDMFESGWFGRGAAFWRWVVTEQAQPYVEAMATMRVPVNVNDEAAGWAIDRDGHDDLLDPVHLADVRARIETEFAT